MAADVQELCALIATVSCTETPRASEGHMSVGWAEDWLRRLQVELRKKHLLFMPFTICLRDIQQSKADRGVSVPTGIQVVRNAVHA